MFKFKAGDDVQVTSGRDRGKKGKIEKVLLRENKVIVAGVNIYKRHKKVGRNKPAGIYEITRPISTAKVALICPKCDKTTRVGFVLEGNTKNRICKKCQARFTS